MATLNGVEFGILKQTTTVIHDNNIINIPGSDTVVNDDAGYSSGPMPITGHVKNESEFDDFKGEFYSGGELTLIADPDSGKQYTVYASGNVTELDGDDTYPLIDIVFRCVFFMKYPYIESVADVTRTKTITSNNQEWSADDDSIDITTDGSVDAVPDIKVTSEFIPLSVKTEYSSPDAIPHGLTWDGSNIWSCDINVDKIYKHNADMTVNTAYNSPNITPTGLTWDGTNIWSCDTTSDSIYKHNADMTVNTTYGAPATTPNGLTWDGTNIWSCDRITDKIYKHNADLTVNTTYDAPGTYPSGLAWDGSNIWSCDSETDKIYKHNADITVNTAYDAPSNLTGLTWDGTNIWCIDDTTDKIYKLYPPGTFIKDVEIYNIADSTLKCMVSNNILTGAIHRINRDGTGVIYYDDDFSSGKFGNDSIGNLNCIHDNTNNEIDIADDGYIYYKIDTKYPITPGIPTLTSQINITTGTPTIQIAADSGGSPDTWYDIDTVIIDDVDTEYPLDSDGNLSLAGESLFYLRFDCVKAATATCSIKSFELDINIHTIYAKNPVINRGGAANTIRCDQDAASGMNCEVSLIYPYRWWA